VAYGGLGAKVAAFKAANASGALLDQAPPGTVNYVVDATDSNGRVIAFEADGTPQGAGTDRERLVLVSGIDLPSDAAETSLNTDTCIVFRSPQLAKLIGTEYAAATTVTGSNDAFMRAEATPSCSP
jgi:hypothetical protein